MEVYFSPLSCSLATRVALYETQQSASFIEVDPPTKRLVPGGADYLEIYPLGLVPTLRADDGQFISENAAILQYVADLRPQYALAPTDSTGRTQLHQWLCFVGTELHKALFVPLLDKKAPAEAKAYVLAKISARGSESPRRRSCAGREFLLDRFTVADAYLVTVLNWTQVLSRSIEPQPLSRPGQIERKR